MRSKITIKQLAITLVALIVVRGIYVYNQQWNVDKIVAHIQQQVVSKEQKAYGILAQLVAKDKQIENYHEFDQLVNDAFFVQIYQNNELVYWNSNALPANIPVNVQLNPQCIRTPNGFYERIALTANNKQYIVFVQLYTAYPYENNFLKNGFTKSFAPITTQAIPEINSANKTVVTSKGGQYLFSLSSIKVVALDAPYGLLMLDLACILLFLFIGIKVIFIFKNTSSIFKNSVIIVFLIACRFLLLYFKLPHSLYGTALFNPAAYASSLLFASLGDVLLNSILLLFVISLTIRLMKNKIQLICFYSIGILLLLANYYMITLLVRDSQISFDLFNIIAISFETFAALLIIALNFSTAIVMLNYSVKLMPYKTIVLITTVALMLFVVLGLIDMSTVLITLLTVLLVTISLRFKNQIRLYVLGLVFICNTVFILVKINQLVSVKEKNYRKAIVEKIAEEQDAIAENLISSIIPKIEKDSVLASIVKQKNFKGDVRKYILQKYFNGYWEKYNIQPHLFNTNGESVVNENINDKKDISQYELEIKNTNAALAQSQFVFITNKNEQNYYVGKFILQGTKSNVSKGTLYVTMQNKLLADEIGFPDLLLDNKIEAQTNLYNFSYARYQNKELITKLGGYNYPLKSIYAQYGIGTETTVVDDNYSHYITQKSNAVSVVLSKRNVTFNNYLGAIIYVLLLLLSVYLLVWLLYFYTEIEHLYTPTLRGRIQLTFFLILIATIVLISYGTITIVKNQYQQKNEALISEKIHSVLISMEQTFGAETKLTTIDAEYLNYTLSRLANVFYTDINLFDTKGRLIASSQPKLFEQGIVSSLMNNDAYVQLIQSKNTSFIQNETIGDLNFLSSYLPFQNNNNTIIGYINLPYFAKQNELAKEVSTYVVTLVNLFLLLFIIVFIITFILANKLMAPLLLVQEKMSQLQLGVQNEHISYTSADEIGKLVNEYNRMVDELAMSANKLVQSEREGAWREMAKQVAHEIKNPLTPMKLSVQQLQRTFNNNDEQWKKMFQNTSHNLIEQIDTLSNIATEFSNFAKLPDAHYERIDVVQIIQQVIGLYEAENNLTIRLTINAKNTIVLGDKDYLNRIFNNLIKNAQQAIENYTNGTTAGLITINIKNVHLTTLQIAIADNGGGIPEAVQEKLFTPYFTTKSTGTGLGLAMVKKMIEQMRGEINYTTIVNESTTFVVQLPLQNIK